MPQYDDRNEDYPDPEQEAIKEVADSNENSAADSGSSDFTSDNLDPPKQGFGQQIERRYDEDQEASWSCEEPAKETQASPDPEMKQEPEEPSAEQEQFEETQEQPEVKELKTEQQQGASVNGESCLNLHCFTHQ